jgi:hypothetical protein
MSYGGSCPGAVTALFGCSFGRLPLSVIATPKTLWRGGSLTRRVTHLPHNELQTSVVGSALTCPCVDEWTVTADAEAFVVLTTTTTRINNCERNSTRAIISHIMDSEMCRVLQMQPGTNYSSFYNNTILSLAPSFCTMDVTLAKLLILVFADGNWFLPSLL